MTLSILCSVSFFKILLNFNGLIVVFDNFNFLFDFTPKVPIEATFFYLILISDNRNQQPMIFH